jgi:DNA-binding beta-propeller fold protein YncE
VSIFSIRGKTLTPAGKLKLDAALGPVDVAISPDGKTVLVTQRRGHGVWRLTLDGTKLTNTGIMIQTGIDPYGVQFSHDGNYAYNTNLLGDPQPDGQQRRGTIHIGTVTSIDMKTNEVVGKVQVGPTPEHLVLSPDGRYMAVTVVNGSSSKPGTPNFHDFGYLKIFRVDGFKLSEVAQARTGRWGQGAAWSRDGRFIMQQTAISRDIEVFRFDGKTLIRDGGATMKVSGRPGAIASQFSR